VPAFIDWSCIRRVAFFDSSCIYRAAFVVLLLSCCFRYIRHAAFVGLHSSFSLAACRKDVKSLHQKYADSHVAETRIEPLIERQINFNKDKESSSEDEMRTHGRITNAYRAKKKRKVGTEWERFVDRGVRMEDEDVEDPLEWWRKHAADYSIISNMAFDLFCIPAMSGECERVFSQSKKLITDKRNRIGHDTVQADLCQKHWLNSSLIE
jgi:hypothetical protein